MKENGIDIRNWAAPIYHVFPRHRFDSLLENGKMALTHPSKWEDPFENFLLTCSAETDDGVPVSLEGLSEKWYGQCWTNNRDSDAMWRIYSADKSSVCVSTTVEKLFSSFFDPADDLAHLKYFIGKVRYETEETIMAFLSRTSLGEIVIGDHSCPKQI